MSAIPLLPLVRMVLNKLQWAQNTKFFLLALYLVTIGMVSRPYTGDSGYSPAWSTSLGLTLSALCAPSAACAPVLSSSPRASSNHTEAIKRLLCHRGYSTRVAWFLVTYNCPSTNLFIGGNSTDKGARGKATPHSLPLP